MSSPNWEPPAPPSIPPEQGQPPTYQPAPSFQPGQGQFPAYQPAPNNLPGEAYPPAQGYQYPQPAQYPHTSAGHPASGYPAAGGPSSSMRPTQTHTGLPTDRRAVKGRTRRRVWPKVLGALFGLAFLVLAVVVGFAVRDGYRALGAINRLVATTSQLETVVTTDPAAAKELVPEIQADIATVANALDGPIWGVATHLPFIGNDIAAIRIVAASINNLVQQGLPEMLDAVIVLQPENLMTLVFTGHFAEIGNALAQIAVGDEAIAQAISELEVIDPADLTARVAEPLGQLIDGLVQVRRATALAAAAANLLGIH